MKQLGILAFGNLKGPETLEVRILNLRVKENEFSSF